MPATTHVLDMAVDSHGQRPSKGRGRPVTSSSPKQIRARARRKQLAAEEALAELHKPLEEWDDEELARGRPRAKDGTFKGRAPAWIDRRLHEEIVKRYQEVVKTEMNVHTIEALAVLKSILEDNSTDDNGKPITPASVKAGVAEFLIEHVIGKPKQRTEADISVKLQGILGAAIVNPSEGGGFTPTAGYLGHGPIDAESWEDDDG